MSKEVAALENNKQMNNGFKKKKFAKKRAQERAPTQLESQLSALFNLTVSREGRIRDIEELGQEGVDHINISRTSSSKLGFLLSPNTKTGFNVFGKNFSSVENLIVYYRAHCTNQAIATADVNTCYQYKTKELNKFPHFNNIYVVVCLAYVSIFKKFPQLKAAMSENTLALDCYRTTNNQRVRFNTARILIRAINEAHASVVEGRKPNLSLFLTRDHLNATQAAFNDLPYDEKLTLNSFIESSFDPSVVAEAYRRAHPEPVREEATQQVQEIVEEVQEQQEEVAAEEQVVDLGSVSEEPSAAENQQAE